MSIHFKENYDWVDLASRSKWSASKMAAMCGISERTLRRYFRKQTGKCLKSWLAERRLTFGVELLRGGVPIKEIAYILGYKQPTNFTRKFKIFWGQCPTQMIFDGSQCIEAGNVRK